ncbi:taste receptor type 2 member 9-like protein [Willisornis vidua]|uniref:Taste receptor type 2 n=1 Tax=Willisornis vidua TaxID=1566151 RepID=A0ABQ9D755_9PASS|nr:taste receptor type 2 member 9-like protein [Willisornis vidua]
MEAYHSPDQPNVTSYDATVLAIVTLEVFAGMWINTFIVSVLCVAWIKKKSLDSNAKILLLLGFTRLWNSFFIYLKVKIERIVPWLLVGSLLLTLGNGILVYTIDGKEICNNSTGRGNFSKVKIDRIVPWLLFGAVLLSLVIAIVAYDIADKVHCNNRNSTGRGSFWNTNIKMDKHFFPSFFLTGFEYAVSFMAVIFAALLLLFSLWKHKCNMQTNSMKDLSMDAHIRAMKSILSFLVMYTINFASLILTMVYTTKKGSPVMFLIVVFQYAFPGVHSLFLIFSNPKLEKTLLRILPCVKFRVCMR